MFGEFVFKTNAEKLEFAKYFLDNYKTYTIRSKSEYIMFTMFCKFLEPKMYFTVRVEEIVDRELEPLGRSKAVAKTVYVIEKIEDMIESDYQMLKKYYE